MLKSRLLNVVFVSVVCNDRLSYRRRWI